jgi:hypothetical protein
MRRQSTQLTKASRPVYACNDDTSATIADDRGVTASALSQIGLGRKVQGIASRRWDSGSEIKHRGAL